MHRRIEAYIVLGTYLAIGLIFGYLIGKESSYKSYLNTKNTQIEVDSKSCRKN